MTWITNKLLLVIMTIWTLWVCAWERADINSPYLKWFNKCWDAKENSGGVVWKEFCAIMKYLSLHYTHKHDEAEKHYKYTELVDMTPFVYRGYAEEDWDTLVNQIYMVGGNQKTTPKKSSSKQRKTNLRNQEVKNVNAPQSAIESVVELEPEQVVLQEKEEEPKQPQEQPVYYEEDENSIPWRTILVVVLIAAGAGWYFFIRDTGDTTPKDSKSSIEMKDNTPVVEEEKSEPTTPLAFLEEFYKGKYENDDYVKQFVTANVLKKLKRDYVYDDPSGDCLATWVFSAYPPGADWGMEAGPLFSKTNIEGKIKVDFKYYYSDGSHKKDYLRTVYLIVTEINGKYLISDYEVVEDNNQEDEQEAQETEMPLEEKESQVKKEIEFKPQVTEEREVTKAEDRNIYDNVDQIPSFPSGQRAMISWINRNLRYPAAAAENGVQGTVVCSFVVERDGSITNVQVKQGIDPSLNKEAVRVLNQMPRWTPGRNNGSTVRVRCTVPVNFSLQ